MSQMLRVALAACTAAAMMVPTAGLAQGIGGPDAAGYIGGSVGVSKASDSFCALSAVPGAACDDKDTAWSVFIGYQANRHFALEAGYRDFGKMATGTPGAETSINAKAFELAAVGILPVGDRLALYGKFGAYFGETDTETNPGFVAAKDSNINLTFGLGAEWEFVKQFRLRVEWQRYQEMSSSDVDLDTISVGLVYRFK